MPSRPYFAVEEHKEIVDAIERRKPELAEKVMRAHIRQSLANFMTMASDLVATGNGTDGPSELQEAAAGTVAKRTRRKPAADGPAGGAGNARRRAPAR